MDVKVICERMLVVKNVDGLFIRSLTLSCGNKGGACSLESLRRHMLACRNVEEFAAPSGLSSVILVKVGR